MKKYILRHFLQNHTDENSDLAIYYTPTIKNLHMENCYTSVLLCAILQCHLKAFFTHFLSKQLIDRLKTIFSFSYRKMFCIPFRANGPITERNRAHMAGIVAIILTRFSYMSKAS